jgi:hypothetical protein
MVILADLTFGITSSHKAMAHWPNDIQDDQIHGDEII